MAGQLLEVLWRGTETIKHLLIGFWFFFFYSLNCCSYSLFHLLFFLHCYDLISPFLLVPWMNEFVLNNSCRSIIFMHAKLWCWFAPNIFYCLGMHLSKPPVWGAWLDILTFTYSAVDIFFSPCICCEKTWRLLCTLGLIFRAETRYFQLFQHVP